MKRKAKIAIIVEGAKTEPQIFNSINELFFSQYDIVSFVLPTCTNIYSFGNMSKMMKLISLKRLRN